MPTKQELDDLYRNCYWAWTTVNGVNGYVVQGKGSYASSGIFLPAAGRGYDSYLYNPGSYGGYWSSTPWSDNSNYAWGLLFNSSEILRGGSIRYYGRSVRPVQGFTE